MKTTMLVSVGIAALTGVFFGNPVGAVAADAPPLAAQLEAWQAAIAQAHRATASLDATGEALRTVAQQFSIKAEREFPVPWDWCLQDAGPEFGPWLSAATLAGVARKATSRALDEVGTAGEELRTRFDVLARDASGADAKSWLSLYQRAAGLRRELRLRGLRERYPQWIFTRHGILGGSHYAYTEGLSDAQHERQFEPGAALCRLELEGADARVRPLIEDPDGVIRDPDVSWDGRHVLFAWKKSDRQDDYHLYEWTAADGSVRQITYGLGFADYEGVYLPNDDILFNSTRCIQTVDCWWTEVSNLYTCSRDGRFLRRLTFDQVHDNFPTIMPDGRVIYTRWEYQDRGQLYVQGLFQMNPDGTGQTEFYGNNSWFPTSLLHARGIPGTQKVVATFSGHHTRQVGKLGVIDPARGRQENTGAQLIAPIRDTPAERIDFYGQDGELFQYPYPLSETEFVVACAPLGWAREPTRFKLYWIAADGRRELLAADAETSCNQAVPLAARPRPPVRPNLVDYRQTGGACYMQDIYSGPGLAGVARGSVKKLRVIALEYRAAGLGWNYNAGPAGDALVCTPPAIGYGSWDVKIVLGDALVHEDGSAFFQVPARTPVYFQAIDERGFAVQTMRSWATLQPGELASCVGCHESKNTTPLVEPGPSLALRAGPQALMPFHGPPRGFSYAREIQPILDRHCTRCHHDAPQLAKRLGWPERSFAFAESLMAETQPAAKAEEVAFSLLGTPVVESLAKRRWSASYLALVQASEQTLEGNQYLAGATTGALVNWVGAQSEPPVLAPYSAGAARSGLLALLGNGHYQVQLTREETEKLACWIDLQVPFCGDYEEAGEWTDQERATYRHFLEKRRRMESSERQNIAEWVSATSGPATEFRDSTESSAPERRGEARLASANGEAYGLAATPFRPSQSEEAKGVLPEAQPVQPTQEGPAPEPTYLSPLALASSEKSDDLFVIAATGNQLLVLDRKALKTRRTIPLAASPTGLALAADATTLFVTAGLGPGFVLVIDAATGDLRARIAAGHSPTAPVISRDGKTLFVCDRFRSRLLAIDVATHTLRGEAVLGREPVAAAVSPDGRFVLTAGLLPAGSTTQAPVAAEVVVVRAADLDLVARVALPNGSTGTRGACFSPDGQYAYLVHSLAHYQLPTAQVDRGWMTTSALSLIETTSWRRLATVLLDDVDLGAANPWEVACTGDGQWLCVSHSGTHDISIIDRPGLHRKLEAAAGERLASVATDLSFLDDLRRRVPLPGKGPRGLAIAGRTLFVAQYFSDSVAVVDLAPAIGAKATDFRLGPLQPLTEVRRGEMLFHDADLCFQRWQSCASCHPDGRVDGLNWDLLNDGPGTPRNTKSMLWAHRTPPAMSSGVRDTAETAVRAGLRHIQFVVRPESDARAIDAYLKSLEPLRSPCATKETEANIARGRRVFTEAGCAECHPAPLYTTLQAYDVGTGGNTAGRLDTPTLVELWRTAPYLHDGRAATLRDVLTRFNPGDRHGRTAQLSPEELEDLVAFLLSL